MATPLSKFMTVMSTNQVRSTNMFELVITTGYSEIDKVFQNITMYGQGFEIPDRTINYGGVSFKGFEVGNAVPLNMAMTNEHTMTINADVNGELRRACLAWQGKTMDPAISDGSLFAGDRAVNNKSIVRVQLLGDDMATPVEIYRLINCKVQNVGPLTVSNVDAAVSQFSLTIRSSFWEIENSKNGALLGQK